FWVRAARGASAKPSQPATQPQPKMPPGIESLDEAAALPVLTQTQFCQVSDERCLPSPDEAEKFIRAMKPAEGATARAIAQLQLSAPGPNAPDLHTVCE